MKQLNQNRCNRCGSPTWYHNLEHYTCQPYFTDSSPSWGIIETWADGTQHPIKTKENPKTILWQTKKRGPKKV